MFKGAITALITPFDNGKIDEEALQHHVELQIKEGIHGIVPCGTTGESPTLSHEEHNRVITICVKAAAGKIPVIAGTGSNSTEEAIMLAEHAKEVGADAILVSSPYYNKPNQEGIYQHYKAINDSVDIPMILYNIPGRSVIDIKDETIARLAKLSNIVGLKDATGDLSRVGSLRAILDDKENFCLLSGEDSTAIAFNAQGGVGVISVTSNIAPAEVAKVQELCLAGNYKDALTEHEKLTKLHHAMFCEPNPAPAKYAASVLGICKNELRLPLVPVSEASEDFIKLQMLTSGIL